MRSFIFSAVIIALALIGQQLMVRASEAQSPVNAPVASASVSR